MQRIHLPGALPPQKLRVMRETCCPVTAAPTAMENLNPSGSESESSFRKTDPDSDTDPDPESWFAVTDCSIQLCWWCCSPRLCSDRPSGPKNLRLVNSCSISRLGGRQNESKSDFLFVDASTLCRRDASALLISGISGSCLWRWKFPNLFS